jgi:hypothetical protein
MLRGGESVESRILYPSRLKLLLYLLLSVALTAVGFLLVRGGSWFGWVAAGIFGVSILVFATMLLPNTCYLRLGPDGFEVRSLFRTWSVRWSQVSRFGVWRPRRFIGPRMVVFNFSDGRGTGRTTHRLASALSGWEGGLPTVYGMPAAELAELLNAYRAASGATS